jgi:hypothetical protein
MLRRTNRLKELLASHGRELWLYCAERDDIPPSDIVEAECPQELQSQLTSVFELVQLIANNEDADAFLVKKAGNNHTLYPVPPNLDWERNVSMLWLSETVFVTRWRCLKVPSNMKKHVNGLLNIDWDDGIALCAYSFVSEGPADPEVPLGFLSRLIQPILPLPVVEFGTTVPVAVALSLVPTTAHNVGNESCTFVDRPSPDIVQALAVHPVHHDVELCVRLEATDGCVAPFWIEADCSAYHQKHHVVATQLACLASRLGIQLPNYIICSLSNVAELATRLIGVCGAFPTTVSAHTLGTARPTLRYDPSTLESLQDSSEPLQEEFDRFCSYSKTLSRYTPVFACCRVAFPRGLRSNSQWDSQVLPAMLLNCLCQQSRVPSTPYAELVIQRINQGYLYHRVSNLAPFDLSAANASAIFRVLRDGDDLCKKHEPALDRIDVMCVENVAISRSHSRAVFLTVAVLMVVAASCTAGLVPRVPPSNSRPRTPIVAVTALDKVDELCL